MSDFAMILAKAFERDESIAFSIIREKCDAAYFDSESAELMLDGLLDLGNFRVCHDCHLVEGAKFSKKTWMLLGKLYCSVLKDGRDRP